MVDPSFLTSPKIHLAVNVAIVIILAALAGCSSNATPAPPAPTGSFSGRVQLYDGNGNVLASDTGVTIAVTGSSVTAQTNDSGAWSIPTITAGTYIMTFTRSGFGTVKQFGDSVLANDTTALPTIPMSQAPTDVLGLQDFEYIAPGSFIFSSAMPRPFNAPRSVVFCFSADSAALANDPSQAAWTIDSAITGSGYDGSFTISFNSIVPAGSLTSGTMIYAAVCMAGEGQNYKSFSHYYDPVAMREVYSALGPHSRILAVKIP